ncbi:16747_t:CDS:2 [Gigaspora rosea]|nr:16747_t:CDS:2 [Gigaspora rosea]
MEQSIFTNELTAEPVQIDEDKELPVLQYVRFKIIILNEEYKSYRIKMKLRFNMCIAQIFIALISYLIGQVLSVAKNINTTDDIGKIGSVISSVFVIASTITTIFTVYLKHSSDKYFERSGNTEITGNLFKPMFLNIDFKILENLYEFQKSNQSTDQSTDHLFRHSLLWLGGVWLVCIILSKSVNNLEYRLNQKYDIDISKYFTEDSKSIEKKLGRIVFRDHKNQPSDDKKQLDNKKPSDEDDKKPSSGVKNGHSSDGEKQNPAWDIIYFGYFVINNLELYPNEKFAIKSILNGVIFKEGVDEENYGLEIINKALSNKYTYKTLESHSKQK